MNKIKIYFLNIMYLQNIYSMHFPYINPGFSEDIKNKEKEIQNINNNQYIIDEQKAIKLDQINSELKNLKEEQYNCSPYNNCNIF